MALFFLFGLTDAVAGWILPTGFVDPDNRWTAETQAYDDNWGTYASNTPVGLGYSGFLELTLPSTFCSRVAVKADYDIHVDAVDIDVFRDGVWVDVYEGPVVNAAREEFVFEAGYVTSVRFRFRYVATGYIYWLFELQLFEAFPVVLPQAETLPASMVENTSAILRGRVVDAGGEPCERRFQYGPTPAYGFETTWRGSLVSGEEFTQQVTGLDNAQNYHYRVQIRNGAGTASGNDLVFTTGTKTSGWVVPTGHSDPDNKWDDEDLAYDDMLSSYARSYHPINDPQWSSYLYFSHAAMLSDKVRFYAFGNSGSQYHVDQAEVDVFRDGAWINVHTGAFPHLNWFECPFAQGTVTEARIRFRVNAANAGLFYELYEFNFYTISFNPPTLSWTGEPNYAAGGVYPTVGDQNTPFVFRVEYNDADNDGPAWKRLFIDKNGDGDYTDPGEQLDLVLANDAAPEKRDGIFNNGEIYTVTTTVPFGPGASNVSYYFGANDGSSDATGTPTMIVSNSPTVVTYLEFQTVPASVKANSYFTVSVKATDGAGNVDSSKTYPVTLGLESGPASMYSDSSLTRNLVARVTSWNSLYFVEPGEYRLRIDGDGQASVSAIVSVSVSGDSLVLDDYDGVDDLTYTAATASLWNIGSGVYTATTGGVTTPDHSYASYDLTQSIPTWTLNPTAQNRWCGWMNLSISATGWRNNRVSCAMVLAANSPTFNVAGVSGYAIGFNSNTPRRLCLFRFTGGFRGNQTTLTGSTVIQDTGYTQTGGMGVNVHVEYNPDGTWTISWLPGGALTPAQAEDVASYPNSITTPVDTTYSGAGYKYAGWAFAHATAENAQFDNFGAYAAFPAPVATAATAVTANSFTANWDAVPGAADYRLDVSESPVFSSFLPGYQNLTVAGTSQSVSVANGGVYYYRVRARAGNKFSANSNVIDVTISTVLSVNLKRSDGFTDYNFWEISGIRSPAQEIVMDGSSCVLVVNDGTVAQDISLSATASTWNLGATSGLDQCVLMGLFNGNTVPAAGDFSTAHDLISGVETWSSVSAGAGAFEGLSNGTNVASGTNRKLYLYLRTPSSVSSGAQQAITVTVGCRAH